MGFDGSFIIIRNTHLFATQRQAWKSATWLLVPALCISLDAVSCVHLIVALRLPRLARGGKLSHMHTSKGSQENTTSCLSNMRWCHFNINANVSRVFLFTAGRKWWIVLKVQTPSVISFISSPTELKKWIHNEVICGGLGGQLVW